MAEYRERYSRGFGLPPEQGHGPGEGKRLHLPIREEGDILSGGRRLLELCAEMRFSSVESMHVRTAFSELTRNILRYADSGDVLGRIIGDEGIELKFIDQGPGITDVEQAMSYGYSSGGSLGLGLPGTKKLADRFEIASTPGRGTKIVFVKFRRRSRQTQEILLRLDAGKARRRQF